MLLVLYFVYLDEFGHIGPYLGRAAARYSESPIFGLGGLMIPESEVRGFSTFFYELKRHLLAWEIERSGQPAYSFEKKGSQLFTTTNVEKYVQLRFAFNRILNRIRKAGGHLVYVGLEKYALPQEHSATGLYLAVLTETIKRVDQFCRIREDRWLCVLDELERTEFRRKIVSRASVEMFGVAKRTSLIEPPLQAESHVFQALQCADWICGVLGRLGCFQCLPAEFPDLAWTERYFRQRIQETAPFSSIRPRREGLL